LTTKNVCVKKLNPSATPSNVSRPVAAGYAGYVVQSARDKCNNKSGASRQKCICDLTSDAMWDEDNKKCTCTISDDFVFVESLGCVKEDEVDTRLNTAKSSCEGSGGTWNSGQCDCGSRKNVGGICLSPVPESYCQIVMHGSYEDDKCMCGSIEMFGVEEDCVEGVIKDKRHNLTLPPIPNNLTLSLVPSIF
jgi:hypothetical protein